MSNAAGDYANLLAMISSGWGGQVTPYDVGLDLGPQQVGQAFQQGTADLNARRKQQAQYDIGRWGAQNEADKTQAGLDVADMGNQLGYEKLGSAENVARIGAEGKFGQRTLDMYKQGMLEEGRDRRLGQRLDEQGRVADQRNAATLQAISGRQDRTPNPELFARAYNAVKVNPKNKGASEDDLLILASAYYAKMFGSPMTKAALEPAQAQSPAQPQQQQAAVAPQEYQYDPAAANSRTSPFTAYMNWRRSTAE